MKNKDTSVHTHTHFFCTFCSCDHNNTSWQYSFHKSIVIECNQSTTAQTLHLSPIGFSLFPLPQGSTGSHFLSSVPPKSHGQREQLQHLQNLQRFALYSEGKPISWGISCRSKLQVDMSPLLSTDWFRDWALSWLHILCMIFNDRTCSKRRPNSIRWSLVLMKQSKTWIAFM